MDQGPLVKEEIEVGAAFVRELDRHVPVKAAFWLKESDGVFRYLYVVSDQVKDTNLDVAYGQAFQVANAMDSPYLDPFRLKLLNSEHPLARAAVEVYQSLHRQGATRLGWGVFGGLTVDDVYIYPPLNTAAAGQTV